MGHILDNVQCPLSRCMVIEKLIETLLAANAHGRNFFAAL
jgi:hypothetical protein